MITTALFLSLLLHHTYAEHIAVIGGGLAGLTAANELRRLGYDVTLYEKNPVLGGRDTEYAVDGFTFDLGPSWYWMPEVFEKVFERFGYNESYNLKRLDPAYRIITKGNDIIDAPGTTEGFIKWSNESKIASWFKDTKEMYEVLLDDWLWRAMVSPLDLFDPFLMVSGIKYNIKLVGSLSKQLDDHISNELVKTLLKWPTIFVGINPETAPALWSTISFCSTNTFYPEGGMVAPVKMLRKIAEEQGVKIRVESAVTELKFMGNRVSEVCVSADDCSKVHGVVSAADYAHVEQNLLPPNLRTYDKSYWEKQIMSPSCLLYYLGFNETLPQLLHHTFYFGDDFKNHLHEIFESHVLSEDPTFYVSATSKTNTDFAPPGGETVFVLVPFTYKLDEKVDTPELRQKVLNFILNRMFGTTTPKSLVHTSTFGPKDFVGKHNAFRGNAFGHANTPLQSFFFKPTMQSKASNFFFAGHLTHPGPGMPPSLVSGIVAADLLHGQLKNWSLWTILSIMFMVGYFVFWCVKLVSVRVRSYFCCLWYFYTGGRTYFAAATLMNTSRFLDTAAMYALFRAADQCVDDEDDETEEKRKKLGEFEKNFWICLKNGVGSWDLDPIFPAVIETVQRRGYHDDLFHQFFRSMRMDEEVNRCMRETDTFNYMEGSAAVIGDFMLPILQPDEKLREALTPHARDLGRAFQMTNFIRDISEDLDLGRQYIPEEVCARHKVVLSEKDYTQPGFAPMMEEMFEYTDKFYSSADIGISLLAPDVCHVIRVARKMYQQIHTKIRANNYDVFHGKLRVPFSEKVKIAAKEIPVHQLVRMVILESMSLLVMNAPWLCVLAWACFTTSFHMEAPTYAQFHLVHTLPVMVFMFPPRRAWKITFRLCVIAFLYTTPWDNLLVYMSGWSYFPERVLYVIGWVPIEEYAFFVIETLITSGIITQMIGCQKFKPIPLTTPRISFAFVGMLLVAGAWWLMQHHFYLGSTIVWVVPIITFQCVMSFENLWYHKGLIFWSVFVSTLYLSIIDHWGIAHGTWSIDDTIFDAYPGLAFEELFFFFATAMMCSCGYVGFMSEPKPKKQKKVE